MREVFKGVWSRFQVVSFGFVRLVGDLLYTKFYPPRTLKAQIRYG